MKNRIVVSWIIVMILVCGGYFHTTHAADSTFFNPLAVPVAAKSAGGGVPVGTVIAWPVSRNPDDMDKWLE